MTSPHLSASFTTRVCVMLRDVTGGRTRHNFIRRLADTRQYGPDPHAPVDRTPTRLRPGPTASPLLHRRIHVAVHRQSCASLDVRRTPWPSSTNSGNL